MAFLSLQRKICFFHWTTNWPSLCGWINCCTTLLFFSLFWTSVTWKPGNRINRINSIDIFHKTPFLTQPIMFLLQDIELFPLPSFLQLDTPCSAVFHAVRDCHCDLTWCNPKDDDRTGTKTGKDRLLSKVTGLFLLFPLSSTGWSNWFE